MRTKWAIGFAVCVLSAACLSALAEDTTTVVGEAVDISCYMGGKSGEGHASCAKACAEKGLPLGIAVKDSEGNETLYLALAGGGKQAKDILTPFMGKQVKATGVLSVKGDMKVLTIAHVEEAAAAK